MPKLKDEIFGTLQQTKGDEQWTAKLDNIGYRLESLAALPHAHALVKNIDTLLEQAKTYASKKMLKNKNDTWPDEDDDEREIKITAQEFMKRMALTSIDVENDSSLAFWFDDGLLFDGHVILVEYNGKKWSRATILG